MRIAEGEKPVGRKIGFVNRTVWPKHAKPPQIHTPIWTPLFETSVHHADENNATLNLKGFMQPRLEAEVVFCLREAPSDKASMHDLADCIEWMAHGIEITSCPYPDWQFDTPDAIAAWGLHGALIIGEPRTMSSTSRKHLDTMMCGVSVSVACDGGLVTAGFGSDILNSPLHALWHLYQMLQNQSRFTLLTAGEIITTGSWTDGRCVAPGQYWQTAYAGIALSGLNLSLVY